MRRFLIWLGAALVGVLVFIAISIAAFALILETNWAKNVLTELASESTGREISIGGDLSADWSFSPLISAGGIQIGNAAWGNTEHMVTIEKLAVRIDLLELLRFRLKIPEIELTQPIVVLEKNERGEANWDLSTENAENASDTNNEKPRSDFPVIRSLIIEDGRLRYRDPATSAQIDLFITQARAQGANGDRRFTVDGEGEYQGEPFSLNVNAGSLNRLRDEDEPYPVDLSVIIGETEASVAGTIMQPLNVKKIDANLSLSGPDLAALFPIVGISLPPSPPYSLQGHLKQQGTVWDFEKFDGQIGESDLSGDIKVDFSEKRPSFYATLASRKLRFEDLGPFVGTGSTQQSSQEPQNENTARVLPSGQIELERLRAMNARVDFSGKEILAPGLPLDDLSFTAKLTDGRLVLEPFTFGISGGTVAGTIILDGQAEQPEIVTDIEIAEVGLKSFFEATDYFDNTTGIIGGKLKLHGTGHTIAEILGASNGRLVIAMTGGTISALAIEAIGLDLGEILGITVTENSGVPIRCMVGDLPLSHGVAEITTLVLDTTDTKLTGDGQIDVAKEEIDAEILAHPKDPSVLTARTPLLISGSFADPSFGVDPVPLAARGAASAALGVVLTPVAALIPFIELGLGEDSNCASLIESARAFTE